MFSWQGQNLCWLRMSFIIDWRVVKGMMNILHTLCLIYDEFFLKTSMRAHLKAVQYGGCSGWCCNNTRTKARAVKTCKKWFCRLITYHWNYNYIPYLLFTFVKSSYNTTTITICIVVFLISRKKQSIGATTIENTGMPK